MNRFFLFLLATSLLVGEVIPTRTLEVIDNHEVDSDTWVVFDVDMTLVIPKDPILWGGSYDVFVALAKKAIPDFDEKSRTHYRNIILDQAEWELIDPKSPELIRSLRKKGATVVALTALEYELSDWRVAQLEGLGFDFGEGPKADHPCYKKGILFSDETPKGEVLVSFFNHLGVKPKKVIFFDDSLKFIKSVESELEKAGIPVTSYYYEEVDHRPIQFVPALVREKMRILFEEGRWPTN